MQGKSAVFGWETIAAVSTDFYYEEIMSKFSIMQNLRECFSNMVGKNNNYVRESKSNEHFQRFALRKLSVGVVSVAVAAGFYLGSGTTAQAATAESDTSAKTEQVVQQDANSTASDSTSASNSSAAVSASSATPVSAESASSVAVSDSPASASSASDSQASAANASESSSQPASSSVASDAAATVSKDSQAASEANSQSAADKQTAQLSTPAANVNESQAANIILSALVVQQAANQQAPAGFTVTDPDYPAGMYRDTDPSHYTYWWAQSSDGNYSLVLSTDRNGDGKVYVFLLGHNNNVLGQYTVDKNKSTEVATDDEGDFGTVYNDGQSGVFVSADGSWKSKFNVFDPKAGEDNGDYGSISFMIPQVETQTTTYVDGKGNTVSDPVVQKGLDGQIYTTQGGKVINGYFAKEPSNANGFMSPFGKQGATYTKDWHDGLKATFTETDTTTGLMHVVVKYHYFLGWRTVKEFDLAPGQSQKVHYDLYKSVTIHSIYIPQTINIQYVYEKLGNLIIDSDSKAFPTEDKTTTQYPNDENDSTKAGNVTIPKVPGFTPTINGKTVTNYTFNPTDYVSDLSQDITVVYEADDQKAAINFYDETGHKLLADQTIHLTGKTGEKVDRTQADKTLADLEKQGYVLDKDYTKQGFPADAAYDNDDAQPQEFTIYLKHGTQDVSNTDKEAKTTATRTINVTTPDGKTSSETQTVNYKRTATKDLVNGHITYGQWQADGAPAWEEYTPTPQKGYTTLINGVAGTKVAPKTPSFKDDKPVNETVNVTYQADAQRAVIKYIDGETSENLQKTDDIVDGHTNETINYSTADKIKEFVGKGYELVSNDFKPGTKFDNDDKTDQTYTVIFKHHRENVDPNHSSADGTKGTKTLTETVHYKYADGTKAAEDQTAQVTFTRNGVLDDVTGIVAWGKWNEASQSYKALTSPTIAGYTPSETVVKRSSNSDAEQGPTVTVIYTADAQTAYVKYVDDTTGETLRQDDLHGYTDETIPYSTAEGIKKFEGDGYVLVSDGFKPGTKFGVGTPTYEVHFKHGTTHTDATDKNAEQKIVTETIHYVYENNQTAKPDYTSAVDFKRGYTTDKVTGKIISYDPWTVSSKKFGVVKSPAIEGYTPNRKQIDEITVTPDSKDVVKTVVYVGNAQEAQAIFYDETTGKEIANTREIATGKTDETISFAKDPNEVVKELEAKGYVFDKDNANNNVFVAGTAYDKNSEVHQYFKYYLKHGHAAVTPDQDSQNGQTTVKQTIKYQYADGTATGLADNVQTLTFKRTGDKDLVTGKVTWPDWSTVAGQQTSAVTSPTLKGYTADTSEIPAATYHAGDSDVTYVVKYSADAQRAVIKYIDGETGKDLQDPDTVDGHTNETINYSTADKIKEFVGKGYELVSNDFKPGTKFDNDDKTDQTYTVIFKHHRENVDPNHSSADGTKGTKTLTETVHYKYADGTKAAEDQTAQVTFTRNGVLDDVTGIVAWGKWNEASQSYKALTSPTIAGYTPSETVVKRSSNSDAEQGPTVTVIYTADAQTAYVKYVDDTTGETLRQDDLHGYTDETIPYSTAEGIKKFEGDGYVLVSDGFKPGTKFGVGTPTYEVHFKHGTTHTSATDENADQKTVTETIHYVDENNQTVQPDYTAAVTFKRGYTTDNVTGKVVSYDPWTIDGKQADSKTFAAVTSPAVEGYTPNHQQINEFTVTPDSKDIVKTVVYVGDPQEAQAIFYDETTGKEISNTRELATGKTDETISFTKDPNEVVKELEKQGYVFDKDNANNNVFADGTTYDKNSEVHQYFKYYFTHATTTVTPDNPKTPADVLPDNPGKNYPSGVAKDDLNKTVTRTINITTPDGKTQTITQKAEFTRSATVDEVTGEVTYGPWSNNVVLESVDVPNIPGYVPSASVPEITVTPNDQDMTINITYKKLDSGKAADQGGNASNGGQSTTGQAAQNGQAGQTQTNAGAQQLPQTGNANNEKGALGLAGAMFAAGLGLGFGSKKKRHEN